MRATSVLAGALLALLVAAAVPGVPLPVRVVLAGFLCVVSVVEFAEQYDVPAGVGAACAATLAVVLVALQYDAVPEGTAGPFAWGIAAVLVGYVGVVSRDWPFTAAFGLLVAVVTHHASTLPFASGRFSFIVTCLVAMGTFVFVLPRYVPREAFYWVVATASAVLVAVGSLAYVVDGYSVLGVTVRLWPGEVALLGVETGVPVMPSVFANPNTLGLVAFAGLAGGLYAFAKGSVFPEVLAIPMSLDALVMVLLGGVQTLAGPLVGAAVFDGLQTWLMSETDYWRAIVGAGVVALCIAFPRGIVGNLRALQEDRRATSGQGASA